MSEMVTVVGAGLAGCEAAWQLAQRGISVRLCEMKPVQHTPAHHSDDFAVPRFACGTYGTNARTRISLQKSLTASTASQEAKPRRFWKT